MDTTKERIVFIEFSREGHPFSVITHEEHQWGVSAHSYDFEFSKKWGLLWHGSGFGSTRPIKVTHWIEGEKSVEARYWVAPGVEVEVEAAPCCQRLKRMPNGYHLKTLFENARECDHTIAYCSTCHDSMPDEPEYYCKHIWWCDICSDLSTPDERCGHEEGEEENV